MSRYINTDFLIPETIDEVEWGGNDGRKLYSRKIIVYSKKQIDEAPTADVVEVVRCKDCTWWKSIFSWNGKEHKVCIRDSSEPTREQNDFCSYGERREDED